MDATSDSAIKLMLVLLFRQMLTGPVHFTVSADTAVMRIDRNRPGGDGQIGFLVIIACQNDVPGRVFRIAPCFEGNLRIIMHKRIRNRKALIDQKLQGDLPCFIPADGLIIRQADGPFVGADVLINGFIGFYGPSVRVPASLASLLPFLTSANFVKIYDQ